MPGAAVATQPLPYNMPIHVLLPRMEREGSQACKESAMEFRLLRLLFMFCYMQSPLSGSAVTCFML